MTIWIFIGAAAVLLIAAAVRSHRNEKRAFEATMRRMQEQEEAYARKYGL